MPLPDLDRYTGREQTRLALKLAPLVLLRPGELSGRCGRTACRIDRTGASLTEPTANPLVDRARVQ